MAKSVTIAPKPERVRSAENTAFQLIKRGNEWTVYELEIDTGKLTTLCADISPIALNKLRIVLMNINGV